MNLWMLIQTRMKKKKENFKINKRIAELGWKKCQKWFQKKERKEQKKKERTKQIRKEKTI